MTIQASRRMVSLRTTTRGGQQFAGLSDPPKAEGRLLEAADWALSTAALLLAEQIGHDTALAASGGERSRRT